MTAEEVARLQEDRTVDYYPVIGSTMQAATGRPLRTVVIAETQTAGQGRHGNSWHSEPGNGIYVSIVLKPAPLLTLALGLATVDAITNVTGIACDLRWPNDVMVGGKKAAGILVQLDGQNAIGGIGINVNHSEFPPELAAIATSLRLAAGRQFSGFEILHELLQAVDTFSELDAGSILRLFARASSYVSGRRVVVDQPGGSVEGVTAGLDPAGYLILRRDDGTDTLIIAGGVRAAGT
jgi:BirA family biotin operon repressor/biotin-[acetyl-CoA-carboxylase] ligase